MEYTHDEYCNMLLTLITLFTCNSQSGTATQEYTLHYPSWCYPNTHVLQQLEQRLSETGNVNLRHMSMQFTHGLQGHQPMKMPQLELWNKSHREAHVTTHENCDYANRASLRSFIMTSCIHNITHREHICFQTIVIYKCKFPNSYINTLQMSSLYTFCGQMKYVLHVGVCSASHNSHL
jgi:hypothetical protein